MKGKIIGIVICSILIVGIIALLVCNWTGAFAKEALAQEVEPPRNYNRFVEAYQLLGAQSYPKSGEYITPFYYGFAFDGVQRGTGQAYYNRLACNLWFRYVADGDPYIQWGTGTNGYNIPLTKGSSVTIPNIGNIWTEGTNDDTLSCDLLLFDTDITGDISMLRNRGIYSSFEIYALNEVMGGRIRITYTDIEDNTKQVKIVYKWAVSLIGPHVILDPWRIYSAGEDYSATKTRIIYTPTYFEAAKKYVKGYLSGYNTTLNEYRDQWYNEGFVEGEAQGYYTGYQEALNTGQPSFDSATTTAEVLLQTVGRVMNIKLFGFITVGDLVAIVVILSIVLFILRLVRA